MLSYEKISLFEVPKDSMLVHGCNAQGVWGAGIAAKFKSRFPSAFESYNAYCKDMMTDSPGKGAAGKALISFGENGYFVGCLVTSVNYGERKDPPSKIIAQTYLALDDFFNEYFRLGFTGKPIYSNKFNSGMFNVPWEETEKALRYFVELYDVDWVVCDPN